MEKSYLCISYNLLSGDFKTFSNPTKVTENQNKRIEILGEILSDKENDLEGLLLKQASGTFILTQYNKTMKELAILTDNMGSYLPVFYRIIDSYLFASTDVELLSHISCSKLQINEVSITKLLKNGFLSDGKTIFENVFQLRADQYLLATRRGICLKTKPKLSAFALNCYDYKFFKEKEISILLKYIKYFIKKDYPISIPLSSGYDSNLLLSTALKLTHDPKLFSVGVEHGISEINKVKRIADYYNLQCNFSYVNSEVLHELPEIAEILQGTIFEPGIFLYHSLSKNMSTNNSKIVMCGDASDQIFHDKFKLDYYEAEEYKFGKDPFIIASYLILKKSGLFLNYYGMLPIYPYCDYEMLKLGLMFSSANKDKYLHRLVCKDTIKENVYVLLKKIGGNIDNQYLFNSIEEAHNYITESRKYSPNMNANPTKRYGPFFDYELHKALFLNYIKCINDRFIDKKL